MADVGIVPAMAEVIIQKFQGEFGIENVCSNTLVNALHRSKIDPQTKKTKNK